jgi:hypothetical protein
MTAAACENRGRMARLDPRALLFVGAVTLALAACSSSSSSGTTAKDAATSAHRDAAHDAGHATAKPDGARQDAAEGADAGGADAGRDATSGEPDAHIPHHDAGKRDTGIDVFVYPEAAIPHDAGSDAPLSPCSSLPDESSYCAAPADGGASTGFFVCMQGNAMFSPCAPNTVCFPTDAGGIACQAP